YRQLHGNLVILRGYVVPELGEGWADEHRGLRLGKKVYNMDFWSKHVRDRPNRRAELDKLGFVWGRLQDEYNIFLEGLLVYNELKGSLLVPQKFICPPEPPWPMSCWGMKLGAKVAAVRTRNLYVKQKVDRWYQLNAMGFVWDLSDVAFTKVYEALTLHRSLNGNLLVPSSFVVPSSAPWPEKLWGFPLGNRVQGIRSNHLYIKNNPGRIRKLNELGFPWQDRKASSYSRVVRALQVGRR
ncbi:unnamed protein product, partial [Discosporangium mesarthrocarpum]